MEKEEKTAASGEYILLNVYSDDHVRNIDRWWSWLGTRESVRNRIRNGLSSPEVWMFHGVPWPYLRLTKDTGTFQEFENEYSTPESLYLLCDPDHVYESFKDEFTVQVHLAEQHAEDVKTEVLQDCRIRRKRATDSGFMKPAFRKQKTTPAGIKSHFGLLPGRDVGRSSTTLSQSLPEGEHGTQEDQREQNQRGHPLPGEHRTQRAGDWARAEAVAQRSGEVPGVLPPQRV